jgi:hypothetical protein
MVPTARAASADHASAVETGALAAASPAFTGQRSYPPTNDRIFSGVAGPS